MNESTLNNNLKHIVYRYEWQHQINTINDEYRSKVCFDCNEILCWTINVDGVATFLMPISVSQREFGSNIFRFTKVEIVPTAYIPKNY
jgi:hypothetical protein